jgi:uncharacterized protein with PQ loop repeat
MPTSDIDYVGLTSAVLISIMFVPQVIHTYKTRNVKGINYGFLFLNASASILGLIYSIHYRIIPMIIANTSAGLFSFSLFMIKAVHSDVWSLPT